MDAKRILSMIENGRIVTEEEVLNDFYTEIRHEIPIDATDEERYNAADDERYSVHLNAELPPMPIHLSCANMQSVTLYQDPADGEIYEDEECTRKVDDEVRMALIDRKAALGCPVSDDPEGVIEFCTGHHRSNFSVENSHEMTDDV